MVLRPLGYLPGLAARAGRTNVALGFIAVVLATGFWIVIPYAVPLDHAAMGITGRFFPRMASIIVGLSGLALMIHAAVAKRADETAGGEIALSRLRRIAPYFVVSIAYVALLNVLGYLTATVPTLAILLWLAGERNMLAIAAVVITVPTGLYLLFQYVMQVPLPKGLFL